ncbi:hypothetical protein NF673_13945 [Pseudomonas moraviensis]|uniref:hypothetical protein n=1 Tax=Pseudomonas moraviensis TaxID=321662 RepID=UPI0020927CAE|nr:hypothetical protein [Pseudomonas moraviensis]UST61756.1 hypothetical protein NF673_13945 [Pseudomonas moraviensis]
MSDNDSINDAPQLLQELKIPGRTGPVSSTPLRWGINLAAAKLNFPRQGLLCQAGPWGTMGNRDSLRILRDSDLQIALKIVDEDAVGTELQMFVEARHLTEGMHTLSYTVTRLGGTPEPSEVMQVLVKLTLPGGPDHSEGPGHPGLVMSIPEDILKDGVHQDNVDAGVSITLGKADGSPPYPFAAAGDTPQFSWGGMFFSGPALTQEQADGETPVIVTIPKETIVDAGDSGEAGLAVAFEVYDLVDNRSDGWSVEQRVVVTLDKTRLGAPLLKEAINNVLDVDNLGDADGTVQVMAVNPPPPSPPPVPPQPIDFEVGDTIFVRIKGTPKEGPPIDIELPGKVLISVPSIPEIIVSNAVLRQLAQAQIALSYRLEKADGSAQRDAKTQFISAIGEIHRLPAPVALEARQGAIDPLHPELKQVTIEIAFGPYFAVGQAIKLFWLGTRPDLTPYLPNLNLRPITQGDMDAQLPLQIIVDKEHLTPIIGKELELYYQLLIEDSVLVTMSKLNQTHAIRESIHADILQIGEPRQELPEPAVDGVVSGVLPSDTNGTTLTVNYLKTVKGDIVTRAWEGSITGVNSDRVELSSITAGQPVAFPIKAELIKGNEGGTVKAYYDIKRAAGGTSYSDTLAFSVGVALDLKEPKIKEAPNDTSLDPLDAQSALTAVVDYDALNGDTIIVTWTGAEGTLPAGSHTTDPWRVTTLGPQEIPLAVSVIAFNLAKSITLSYTVTRGTQDPKESRIRALAVSPIAQSDLPGPLITQASEQGEGPELDVSQLTTNATLRANSYPHIALKQYVWLKAKGTLKGGGDYLKTFWQPPGSHVSATWINQGFYAQNGFPLPDLQSLEDGRDLELEFKAGFGGTQVESEAVTFARRTYRIKALDLEEPRIKEANDKTLNPFAAKDTLTAVIPAYTNMIGTQVSVTWSGTPGEGSATAGPFDVTAQADKEVPLPNSLVAFNLAKTVEITYIVIRGGTPQNSQELSLIVQPIADEDENLPTPTVDGADSDELDVTQLEEGAQLRIGKWPLQASNQCIWLRYDGTDESGNAVDKVFWTGEAHTQAEGLVTAAQIAWFRELKDGMPVRINFKVNFDKVANAGTTVGFPVRTYTVKAIPPLEIEKTPMVLDGIHLYPAAAPYNPPFEKTAFILDSAHKYRVAEGGRPPYNYMSSDPTIATVDPITGHVVSTGNGKATITVFDSRNSSVSYEVFCSNVYELIVSPSNYNYIQAKTWIENNNAYLINIKTHEHLIIETCLMFGFQQTVGERKLYWAHVSNLGNTPIVTQATGSKADYPTIRGFIRLQEDSPNLLRTPMGFKLRVGIN